MNPKMREALTVMEKRFQQIVNELESIDVGANLATYKALNKERASLENSVKKYQDYKTLENNFKDLKLGLTQEKNRDLLNLIKEEIEVIQNQMQILVNEIEESLIPKDPNDDKNVIMEIRGAAGGDEANIFAGDLFRMYRLYGEKSG